MWHVAQLHDPAVTAPLARALTNVIFNLYDRLSMLCARCRRRPAIGDESNNTRSSESEASQRRQAKEKEEASAKTSLVGRIIVAVGQQIVAANLGACPPPLPPLYR
ncbi:protein O24 [Cercopithecine betaherpesvirus 5]|uniref:Protein O24 n=1 Tax=Simian cytomegalovirus (strain Colburn) TaxID=50292 RepID=G8XU70_SCMVC|nr:protein O24 [Cercopithecine betaherpesvirus 5]